MKDKLKAGDRVYRIFPSSPRIYGVVFLAKWFTDDGHRTYLSVQKDDGDLDPNIIFWRKDNLSDLVLKAMDDGRSKR